MAGSRDLLLMEGFFETLNDHIRCIHQLNCDEDVQLDNMPAAVSLLICQSEAT